MWKARSSFAVAANVGSGAEFDVEDGVGEMFMRAVVDMVDQQACAAARRHAHGDAGARKSRAGARGYQRQLHDVVAPLASRSGQQQRAGGKRCVERCEAFSAAAGKRTQQLFFGRGLQRAERKATERRRDGAHG